MRLLRLRLLPRLLRPPPMLRLRLRLLPRLFPLLTSPLVSAPLASVPARRYVVAVYSVSEQAAYHLSELIEDHAYNT